jgi:hypothetical protein
VSTVSELMHANLIEVFGERDPERRAAAAARTYAEDVVFHDPEGAVTGLDALVGKAGALLDASPGFGFTPRGPIYTSAGELGVLAWAFGPADGPPAATGLDVALVRDGRIATLHTMIDEATP